MEMHDMASRKGTKGDLEGNLAAESHRGCGGGWQVESLQKRGFISSRTLLVAGVWLMRRKEYDEEGTCPATARQGDRRRRRWQVEREDKGAPEGEEDDGTTAR
jgi:hypothetical protein